VRAGGKIDGELWTTRVHSLRPGDYVKAAHWSGEIWTGGEALLVLADPVRLLKTSDRPAGYFDVRVQAGDDPREWRVLCVLGDDQVQLTAREVRETSVETPQPKRKQKPKKGQLRLFDD
jgi:hypothetical protein